MQKLWLALSLALLLWSPLAARRLSDAQVVRPPADQTRDLSTLAHYLCQNCASDEEKAEQLFRWVAENIAYDLPSLRHPLRPEDVSPQVVLQRRQAVCSGYANLYQALGRKVGLEVEVVNGRTNSPVGAGNNGGHAWNAVKLDGGWVLVDATWGAGYISGETFFRSYCDDFFEADPRELIQTHFPEDPRWQLLPTPVSLDEWSTYTYRPRHRAGRGEPVALTDFRLSTPATAPRGSAQPGAAPRQLYSYRLRGVQQLLPRSAELQEGSHEFHLQAPGAARVMVQTPEASYDLLAVPGKPGWFRSMVPIAGPSGGLIRVLAQFGSQARFEPLLEYRLP